MASTASRTGIVIFKAPPYSSNDQHDLRRRKYFETVRIAPAWTASVPHRTKPIVIDSTLPPNSNRVR